MKQTLLLLLLLHAAALLSHAFQLGDIRNIGSRPVTDDRLLSLKLYAQNDIKHIIDAQQHSHERRTFIQNVIFSSALISSSSSALAIDISDVSKKITHKVYMDVRISRADGSFYVRDNRPEFDPAE